jgi:hypothetical protein
MALSISLTMVEATCFLSPLSAPGGRSKGGQGTFEGVFHFKDELEAPWSCTSQDGQSGKIIIDGKEFDLTAGALFLISAKDKAVHVQQLAISSEQLQTCSDAKKVITVLKGKPEAEAFLQSCRPNY